MNLERRYRSVRQHLKHRSRLEAREMSSRAIARAVSAGTLVRVSRGWYVGGSEWASWTPEDRHLAQVIAVQEDAQPRPLFSHLSAAVLHGLPIYGFVHSRVRVTQGLANRASSTPSVLRHRSDEASPECHGPDGLRMTAPDRTLRDVVRTESFERSIAAADAALRQFARQQRVVDDSAVEHWRGRMREEARLLAGRPGAARLRRIAAIADPQADSVLESVSRLQLLRLGFSVATQVPVKSPRGGWYFVDFELLDVGVLAECDGKQKYIDPKLLRGESASDRVYREKMREDWIRGVTGKRFVRWSSTDVATPERLARRLASFGVPIPSRVDAW